MQLRQEQAYGAAREKDHELSQMRSSKDQLQSKIDNLETALALERGRAEGKQKSADEARQHGTALEERLRYACRQRLIKKPDEAQKSPMKLKRALLTHTSAMLRSACQKSPIKEPYHTEKTYEHGHTSGVRVKRAS